MNFRKHIMNTRLTVPTPKISRFVIAALPILTIALSIPVLAQKYSPWSALENTGSQADRSLTALFPGPPQSIAMTSNRDGNNEAYVMNPDGSGQTNKTNNPTRSDVRPDISPDGSQIVFASNRDGNTDVYIMNFDGTNVRQLSFTSAPSNASWPRWSSDGEWIAFQAGSGANFQIYKIRLDGTDLTQVTNYAGLNQFPAWSPDGTKLAIRRDTDIYVINADGSNPVRLTNVGTVNQMASWSSDGTRIAFLSDRAGYLSVFIMNADGTDQFNFTPRPIGYVGTWTSRAPAWSPNGEYVYFTAVRSATAGSLEQIFVKPAGGGDETQLTSAGANSEASVRRVQPPTITDLTATPNVLWPANNKMVSVALTVDVTDSSDPAPFCRITNVVSNEAILPTDWQLTGLLTLDLRARRSGRGFGRVYTITVTCTNTSELSSTATATVSVPHDQGM